MARSEIPILARRSRIAKRTPDGDSQYRVTRYFAASVSFATTTAVGMVLRASTARNLATLATLSSRRGRRAPVLFSTDTRSISAHCAISPAGAWKTRKVGAGRALAESESLPEPGPLIFV